MKPTREQQLASDPKQSVWVSASAGTGKTRILVTRLLRLLLAGSQPEKLLCITFTKAAAAEVLQRIQSVVLKWSICDTTELQTALSETLERTPKAEELSRARRLLPIILQVPGGMKIMTIHAFCQSVLARFPLEAEVTPGFNIIDEAQSQALLNEAKYQLLEDTSAVTDPDLFDDLSRFFDRVYEDNQNGLIQAVLQKRYRLAELLPDPKAPLSNLKERLCALVGIKPAQLHQNLEQEFLSCIPVAQLQMLIPELLQASGATLPKTAQQLQDWINHPSNSDTYKKIYLTGTNTPIKLLFSGLEKSAPGALGIMSAEAERCLTFLDTKNKVDLVKDTYALLHICLRIMNLYQELKRRQSVLDYEDQILLTSKLLQNPLDSQWVHYKLDGGIDHILVDEAQDTSPAQWNIIKGITEEFFSGNARYEQGERTLFVVGDEKQSIFSFQNADPVEFSNARHFFADKARQANAPWQDVALIDNFRSAPLILKLTDQVFSSPQMTQYVSKDTTHIEHHAFNATRAGQIEIWPLLQPSEKENPSYIDNNEWILAESIAQRIEDLMQQNIILSNGKKLQYGDIMILVRTRQPLVAPLTKAFKDRSIPVTSADRLVLGDQLAVQDCLAAMQSCLHPQDDYALSCFLKSPFIGLSEEALFHLCAGRTGSVWANLLASSHHAVIAYIEQLMAIINTISPGHFIHTLLSHPCPADTRSGRHTLIARLGFDCDDVLDELLLSAYNFIDNANSSCQGFVTWMQHDATTIKRANSEMDKSRVQIMTVHASKGLEAPIVFLADAHSKPGHYKNTRDVLWQDRFADGFLWGTGDAQKAQAFVEAKENYLHLQYSEYYRLLYVALTRAEERLVVCGIQKKAHANKDYLSWYECIENAVATLKTSANYQSSEQIRLKGPAILLTQTGAVPEPKDQKPDLLEKEAIPEELLTKPPQEAKRIRPLRPSRPQEEEPPVFSPLHTAKNDPYRRGKILHTLFRLLPDYPPEEQEDALNNLITHSVADPREQQTIYNEVMKVLRDPEFAHLFTPAARAEVPVVGEIELDGQSYAISGQIDRLLVEEARVLIVDYKTNRPPVLDETKIPSAYRHQLRAYKALLQKIYPDKKIETALLWTSVPYLLPVSS